MGASWRATCKDCDHTFAVNEGGGFTFHLLRCRRCGREKSISFDKLGEIHVRYLKGLPGPYSVATATLERELKATVPGRAITERTYERKVREFAGRCRCGGLFSERARPRCPRCRSTRLTRAPEGLVLYD